MEQKLIHLLKGGNIVIPFYILQKHKEFKVSFEDFVFLMYLYNLGSNAIFNPKKISEDTGYTFQEVMQFVSNLSDKGYVEIKVVKNEKEVSEDVISLDKFYNKLSIIMIDDLNHNEDDSISCFEMIEKALGRMLNGTEYEIIRAWVSGGNSNELIMEAVKEAVLNGVSNFRYIDKILYEWGKKGIKTKKDVEKNRIQYRKKEEKEEKEEELFDYNWFEDDDVDEY